jgi:hypothetical protein
MENRDGWAAIDSIMEGAIPAPDQPAAVTNDSIDKFFVEAFNNQIGMRILRYWKHTYLDQPVCMPGSGVEVGFHREGQNSIIREALMRINRGLTPKS